jgi:hypothetical protein
MGTMPLAAVLLIVTVAGGCLFGGLKTQLADTTTKTVNVLDDAIDALQTQSSAWQTILQEAQSKLTDAAQSTIRNEIGNLITRSIAQAGVEFRCNADFIGARVRQQLIRIKAKLLGQTVPPAEPAICQVVPIAVDRSLVPDRIKQIEFYGYDFNEAKNLAVFLESAGGRVNVTDKLDRPTHYAMTLKFGANGIQLDASSQRLVLEWDNRQISSMAVIQPATPVCVSKLVTLPIEAKVTFMPPHTKGDRDFSGNGPTVNLTVVLVVNPQSVSAYVFMRAKETKSDWTTAEGSKTFPLNTPDSGWRIDRVVGNLSAAHRYTDGNHEVDSFDLGSGGPVKRLEFVGDRKGDEAGTQTKVDITFNVLRVELTQTADCVPDSAVRTLRNNGLINPRTFTRLEPGVNREIHRRGTPR